MASRAFKAFEEIFAMMPLLLKLQLKFIWPWD
jgi:hypothetical protein